VCLSSGLPESRCDIVSGRVSGYSAHLRLFLSTVVVTGQGGNPRHCSGAFSHMRQVAANCLLIQDNPLRLSGIPML
jgi:hypothetical protein